MLGRKLVLMSLMVMLTGCNATEKLSPSDAANVLAPPPSPNIPPSISVASILNGNENTPIGGNLLGVDIDGGTMTYSCTGCPIGLVLDTNTGVWNWTPTYNQGGSYPVTFTVDDGEDQTAENCTLTIANTNRPPSLGTIPSESIDETDVMSITPTVSDPDGDGTTLTVTSALPSNASFDGTTLTFTPDYTQAGSYSFDFEVDDGDLSDIESLSVVVGDLNTPPTLNSVGAQAHTEGTLISFAVSGSDVDGDTVTFSMINSDLPGAATFDGTNFAWQTSICGVDAGTYNATFRATDTVNSDDEIVTFTITEKTCVAWDTAPQVFNATPTSLEIFIGWAIDPEADPITYQYWGEYSNIAGSWNPSYNTTTRRVYLTGLSTTSSYIHYFLVSARDSVSSTDNNIYRYVKVQYVSGSTWSVTAVDVGSDWSGGKPADASIAY